MNAGCDGIRGAFQARTGNVMQVRRLKDCPTKGETMTNFATRMMVAAATVLCAAGVVSAQTMKAEIP